MKNIIFISILGIVFFCPLTGAQEYQTLNATESPSLISIASPIETTINEAKFRVKPIVKLRLVNSKIGKYEDGMVELYMINPIVNDVLLEVDLEISVPSGIYIYAVDELMPEDARTVAGHFSVPPGSSRIIRIDIGGTEIGNFSLHFSGMYWPDGNNDEWYPISFDSPIEVLEPSLLTIRPIVSSKMMTTGEHNENKSLLINLINEFYKPLINYYELEPSAKYYTTVNIHNKKNNSILQTIGILSTILFSALMLIYGPGSVKRKDIIKDKIN